MAACTFSLCSQIITTGLGLKLCLSLIMTMFYEHKAGRNQIFARSGYLHCCSKRLQRTEEY